MNTFLRMQRCTNGPTWRWQLAERISTGTSRSVNGYLLSITDDTVHHAVTYQRASHRGPAAFSRAIQRYPHIVAACALWESPKCNELKILILGNCARADIAQRYSISPHIIEVCEKLFFDVRDCRDAIDWISIQVIGVEQRAGNAALASRLTLAYTAGPHIAQAILEADAELQLEQRARRLFHQRLSLHLKMQEALSAPLGTTAANAHFLKLYFNYEVRLRRIELQEKRFQERCAEAIRRAQLQEEQREQAAQERAIQKEALRRQALHQAIRIQECQARRAAAKKAAMTSSLAQLCWSSRRVSAPDGNLEPFRETANTGKRGQVAPARCA